MGDYGNLSEFTTHKEAWVMNGKQVPVTIHKNSISDYAIRDLAMEILRVEAENEAR